MKKGISLIVLVITIIIMIIIAGAIILALNSSNVTGKASWAQISSDRANFQSEYATILANVLAKKSVGEDYTSLSVGDVVNDEEGLYDDWEGRVTADSRFDIIGDEDETSLEPAAIKVVVNLTETQAEAYGLEVEGTGVKGYDWVVIGGTTTGD